MKTLSKTSEGAIFIPQTIGDIKKLLSGKHNGDYIDMHKDFSGKVGEMDMGEINRSQFGSLKDNVVLTKDWNKLWVGTKYKETFGSDY